MGTSNFDTFDAQEPGALFSTPAMPEGFLATGEPIPLISIRDGWWVVPAHCQADELNGLLIFEDRQTILFLASEEAMTIGALVLKHLPVLLQDCDPDYLESSVQADGVTLLRGAWWSREAEKTRAMAGGIRAGLCPASGQAGEHTPTGTAHGQQEARP